MFLIKLPPHLHVCRKFRYMEVPSPPPRPLELLHFFYTTVEAPSSITSLYPNSLPHVNNLGKNVFNYSFEHPF